MHAGFVPLRRHLPMNMWRPVMKRDLTPEAAGNVQRIDAMWSDCRARFGRGGPFLFGAFTAADAMYAPVVSRFVTYAVDVGAPARAYIEAIVALPAWREWTAAALGETWVLPQDEPDWPTVHKVNEYAPLIPKRGCRFSESTQPAMLQRRKPTLTLVLW